MPESVKTLPKWQNYAKSGHTEFGTQIFVVVRHENVLSKQHLFRGILQINSTIIDNVAKYLWLLL